MLYQVRQLHIMQTIQLPAANPRHCTRTASMQCRESKMAPKWLQDGPKMAPRWPKMAPGRPKMAPRLPKMAPSRWSSIPTPIQHFVCFTGTVAGFAAGNWIWSTLISSSPGLGACLHTYTIMRLHLNRHTYIHIHLHTHMCMYPWTHV